MKKFLYVLLLILFPYVSLAQDYESPDFWKTATLQDIQPLLTPQNINKKLENDITYLMMAVAFSKEPLVLEALIEAGADVNAETKYGDTPIIGANSPQFIKILKKAGAKINHKDKMGWTALAFACHHGNSEIISALIEAGADINFKVDGQYNLLMIAAQKNPDAKVIQTLINAGLDVNAKTKDGDTALTLAAMSNPNSEVIQNLIKAGANTNSQAKDFTTPLLMAAAHNPNPDVIDILIKNGADINVVVKGPQKGLQATPIAAALLYNSNIEVTKRVLSNGVNLNKAGVEGTPLFMDICPLIKDPQLIHDMVKKYGANIKAKTKDAGSSVLMVCSMFSQNPDVIQALIDDGAVVNERRADSWTALMSAAANPNSEIIKVLIKNGADTRARWKSGNATALMIACRTSPNRDIIMALIEGGSDIQAKDNDGKTAYDWLKENPALKDDQELLNNLR